LANSKSAGSPGSTTRKPKSLGQRIFAFFSSFGLAVVVLCFLFLITLLGTLAQVELGLHGAIEKYFNPLFVVHHFGKVPLPLPGGYLLMAILFVNILCGAIISARKNWRTPGMLISHFSIVFLIFAGFVSYHWKREGNMALFEGESSGEFQSYHDWVIEVEEIGSGTDTALIIDQKLFADLGPGKARTFQHESLPIDLQLTGYFTNAKPDRGEKEGLDAEGFFLQQLDNEPENERNLPGLIAIAKDPVTGNEARGLLWGGASEPWTIKNGERTLVAKLKRRAWKLPFALTLDKFTRELHPGTQRAKIFLSDVTKVEDGREEPIKITMNEPLRQDGYTFFQASWGPDTAKPGDKLYSVFAVVDNPSDMWPLYSCIAVGVGLLIHFIQKLSGHLGRTARTRLRNKNAASAS